MVFEKLKGIIHETLGVAVEDITLESSIREDFGGDSLDAVEIVMACEEEFDIEIPDEDIVDFKTVKEFIDYIEAHK